MSSFYLPVELQQIISQYSKPLTRPDYKRGSFMMRSLVVNNGVISVFIFRMFIESCSLDISDIKLYAEVLNQEV